MAPFCSPATLHLSRTTAVPSLPAPTIPAPRRRQSPSLRIFAAATSPQYGASTEPESAVAGSVRVLKTAAKTRRVPAPEVLSALAVVKRAKLDPSHFLPTLGGTQSPGRTWMLIFTAQGKLDKGRYFPVTAVQRFDAAGKRIENGVYLGAVGSVEFEGRLSWKTRILAFVFERVKVKVGPFGPVEVKLWSGGDGDSSREPGTKDPFFVWLYVDEELAVAQGRRGGVAFWCRCRRVT